MSTSVLIDMFMNGMTDAVPELFADGPNTKLNLTTEGEFARTLTDLRVMYITVLLGKMMGINRVVFNYVTRTVAEGNATIIIILVLSLAFMVLIMSVVVPPPSSAI